MGLSDSRKIFYYYSTVYSRNVSLEFCSRHTRIKALLTLVVHVSFRMRTYDAENPIVPQPLPEFCC